VPELRLTGAGYRYPGGEREVLSDLDLDLRPGRPVWLRGPNGVGKTTLLEVMAGLRPLTRGTVTWDGEEPRRGALVYLPTEPFVIDELDAEEHTGLVADLWCLAGGRRSRYVDQARTLRRLLDLDTGRMPAGSYSQGMKEKLAFSLLLALEPPALLLDEPFTALDVDSLATCQGLLRARAQTMLVVLSSHLDQIAAPLRPTTVHLGRASLVGEPA
jgi:ABC-type multidrug transport system ATPase subunit